MPNADAPILLFDGDCNLCNGWVKFVLRHEADASIRFASLQSNAGRQLLRQHQLPEDRLDTMVFIEHGTAYVRSTAVLRVAKRLRRPYRWLAVLRFVPQPIRDRAYRLVARYRLRLFGRAHASCLLPTRDSRARMLE